jgi:hypothetical protein
MELKLINLHWGTKWILSREYKKKRKKNYQLFFACDICTTRQVMLVWKIFFNCVSLEPPVLLLRQTL